MFSVGLQVFGLGLQHGDHSGQGDRLRGARLVSEGRVRKRKERGEGDKGDVYFMREGFYRIFF